MNLGCSQRLQMTPTAVIDILLETYNDVKYNLAPGAPRAIPKLKAIENCCNDLKDRNKIKQYSRYDEVIGSEELRKRWINYIIRNSTNDKEDRSMKELIPNHEIMITSGCNQAFFNTIMTICDVNDEIIIILPYYFSHINAIIMNRIKPICINVSNKTFLPSISDILSSITDKTRAVLITNPGNPSGIIFPNDLLDGISKICRDNNIFMCIDEAYKEYNFLNANNNIENSYTPLFDDHIIKFYTMSKAFGMAGWRVGCVIYPDKLSINMKKIQDTIPTHACIFSQALALECLKFKPTHAEVAFRIRNIFVEIIRPVYDELNMTDLFVVPNGAFYLFLPYEKAGEERHANGEDDDKIVDILARKFDVLTTPGHAFGMCGLIRICYGAVEEEDAEASALCLAQGLRHCLQNHVL